jgi:hypothetical protein
VDAIGAARQQAGKVGLTKVQWQRPKVVAIERKDVKGITEKLLYADQGYV